VIFGKEFICLFGEDKFDEDEFGISFFAGPETFVQINSEVRRRLYDKVIKLAGNESLIIDAYSGGGLLTAMFAKNCGLAYGIEIVPEAVNCANELAEKNGLIGKMINICGRVEDKLKPLLVSLKNPEFTIVIDPPRKGCDITVIRTILELKPKKIIYISCNPATLARDIGIITGNLIFNEKNIIKNPDFMEATANYSIELIQPYDMFPQTKHVETLISLSANK
jgi:23S rRNA (uracil1939-C5)-methyltransferase